jgi:hypothetical protein
MRSAQLKRVSDEALHERVGQMAMVVALTADAQTTDESRAAIGKTVMGVFIDGSSEVGHKIAQAIIDEGSRNRAALAGEVDASPFELPEGYTYVAYAYKSDVMPHIRAPLDLVLDPPDGMFQWATVEADEQGMVTINHGVAHIPPRGAAQIRVLNRPS